MKACCVVPRLGTLIRPITTTVPLQQRNYSSPPPPPPTSAYAHLPNRALLSLTGPDSTSFLAGLTSSSPSTASPSGYYTAFLNAPGRLLYDCFIYRHGEAEGSWLLEIDSNEVQGLAKHLKRFKLRRKLQIRVLDPGELDVYSSWTSHPSSSAISPREIGCADERAPAFGRRTVLGAGKKPEVDAEAVSEVQYRIRRYLHGIPEGQTELIGGSALPQESGVDYMGGIDYHKGCYVGQELTIRTYHRGVVRKRICPVMIYGEDEAAPMELAYRSEGGAEGIELGTKIGRVEKTGASTGKFLRGVGGLGLGLCRLGAMTGLVVGGEEGSWKEGDEFAVEVGNGETRRLKAFVPEWWAERQS